MRHIFVLLVITSSLMCALTPATAATVTIVNDPNPIVITEGPNNTLSVTHNGSAFGAVTFIGPYSDPTTFSAQGWVWTPPLVSPFTEVAGISGGGPGWTEPESSNTTNNLDAAPFNLPPGFPPISFVVQSETAIIPNSPPPLPNGATTPVYETFIEYGGIGLPTTQINYLVTFNDLGDAQARVPEPSTMLLVGSALCAFAALRCRKLSRLLKNSTLDGRVG